MNFLKLLLLINLVFGLHFVNAQNFSIIGKTWVFLLATDYPSFSFHSDKCYKIASDTTINSKNYKKLNSHYRCKEPGTLWGYIRETKDGQVYFRYNTFHEEQEYLLYDFGMEAGDTSYIGWNDDYFYLIDSTDVNKDGKKLYYVSESTGDKDVWIEGVGSIKGLLKEVMVGESQIFTCCLLNGEALYHNPNYKSCFFDSTINSNNDFQKISNISIFPNPAKNNINVSIPYNVKIKKTVIIDLSGRVVQKWYDLEPGENRLKIESVLPGVYLLRMETENGIKTEKLVVQ